jgi:hypothetical protein
VHQTPFLDEIVEYTPTHPFTINPFRDYDIDGGDYTGGLEGSYKTNYEELDL